MNRCWRSARQATPATTPTTDETDLSARTPGWVMSSLHEVPASEPGSHDEPHDQERHEMINEGARDIPCGGIGAQPEPRNDSHDRCHLQSMDQESLQLGVPAT